MSEVSVASEPVALVDSGRPPAGDDSGRPHAGDDDKRATQKRCAVCRTESLAQETLRFVLSPDGELRFDPGRKAPGRGVSICTKNACLLALRPGLPGVKALGEAQPLNEVFWASFDKMLAQDVLGKLGLLWRQRKLIVGAEPAKDAANVSCAMVANDAGSSARDAVREKPVVVQLPVSCDALGHALGKDRVAVVALGHDDVTKAMGLSARAVLWSDRAAFQGGNHG
jgi:Protein of unknown function (DUF448)